MTVDRGTRKNAKKKWQKHAKDAAKRQEDSGVKRIRKKSNAKRRLCHGMCYNDPSAAITEEDRQWGGEADADGQEHAPEYDSDVDAVAQRIASNQAATGSGAMEQQATTAKPKLSTSVNLPSSIPGNSVQGKKKAKAKAPVAGSTEDGKVPVKARPEPSPALAPYHEVIQVFMASAGFSEPTPIQERCWPAACAGADIQGVAQPGSGKTLSYMLPVFSRLKDAGHTAAEHPEGPLALVLVPTRELATQVAQQARQLRGVSGLHSACVYGGVAKDAQVEGLLSRPPHVLVATPGRLLDLMDDGVVNLRQVRIVVLDEADKMLSLGFEAQLQRLRDILLPPAAAPAPGVTDKAAKQAKKAKASADSAPSQPSSARPQVMLYTATMPPAVLESAGCWLSAEAVKVEVSNSASSISSGVTQIVQVCAEHKKPAKLLKHLDAVKAAGTGARNLPRVLVFANKIKTVRFLHQTVTAEGYRCEQLHGQRTQAEREAAISAFRAGKVQILMATDVAARGLDIRGLPYVVNYDFPPSLDTYIHRVGRTGRLAATGHAFSFFTRNLAKIASPLAQLLSAHAQTLDPNLQQLAAAWKEAAARAGGEAVLNSMLHANKPKSKLQDADATASEDDEDDDEDDKDAVLDSMMEDRAGAADVMEGLRALGVPQARMLGGKAGKRAQHDTDSGNQQSSKKHKKLEGADRGSGGPGLQQRLAAAKGDRLAFMAASAFSGSRPGYIFKMGGLGLGYYSDVAPQVKKASSAQQKGKGPIIPIGPQGRGSWSDSEEEDELEHDAGTLAPPKSKKKKGKTHAGSADSNGEDSHNRKKALPGRLRKKLAKAKHAKA